MFTTFSRDSSNGLAHSQHGSHSSSPSTSARPKRNQVARACDSCRVHRIKCDDKRPCSNCQSKGEACSNKGTSEARTLPAANREIERLKLRIRDLEDQLQASDHFSLGTTASIPNPSSSKETSDASSSEKQISAQRHGGRQRSWEGIHTNTARSQHKQYYGPASSHYFIGRMSSYLALTLQQPQSDRYIQPKSASMAFASPTAQKVGILEDIDTSINGTMNVDSLTGIQEDYFLGLFWQSYHCTLQIIDEVEFKEHYRSLWSSPGTSRRPSALVDIVLALCMQYGVAFVPRNGAPERLSVDTDGSDAAIAGRWLYRRSQTLLSVDLESPSIMTLQCHILAVYYLCHASFQNMAHNTLAVAIRTAQTLGLHLEPPDDIPRKEAELRKRLWWTLYAMECKTCMKLGRPWSAQMSDITCTLPSDEHKSVLLSGSSFASFGDNVTWLTYNLQNIKLILAARTIYVAFYDKCLDILDARDETSIYSDSRNLELCAQFLSTSMEHLQKWAQNVPEGLRMKRKGSEEPFPPDRSPLQVELFAPVWLQRQRLLLELFYHNLAMNLYRPFISFSTAANSGLPFSEGNAVSSVNHAMAITNIMHQIITETDILHGWYEAFQWQWNATLSLIGFTLAYPFNPSTPSAREAIEKAVVIFETFGKNFAMAVSAAKVTRDLVAKVDWLTYRLESNMAMPGSIPSDEMAGLQVSQDNNEVNSAQERDNALPADQEPSAMFQHPWSDSMDMAFAIDSFSNPMYAGNTNLSDMWSDI